MAVFPQTPLIRGQAHLRLSTFESRIVAAGNGLEDRTHPVENKWMLFEIIYFK